MADVFLVFRNHSSPHLIGVYNNRWEAQKRAEEVHKFHTSPLLRNASLHWFDSQYGGGWEAYGNDHAGYWVWPIDMNTGLGGPSGNN